LFGLKINKLGLKKIHESCELMQGPPIQFIRWLFSFQRTNSAKKFCPTNCPTDTYDNYLSITSQDFFELF